MSDSDEFEDLRWDLCEEVEEDDFEDSLTSGETVLGKVPDPLFRAGFDNYVKWEYPNFKVNWTGEGTYYVISAAKECRELERIRTAVEKGIITQEQLEGALEEANKNGDAEVSEIILQWMAKGLE